MRPSSSMSSFCSSVLLTSSGAFLLLLKRGGVVEVLMGSVSHLLQDQSPLVAPLSGLHRSYFYFAPGFERLSRETDGSLPTRPMLLLFHL